LVEEDGWEGAIRELIERPRRRRRLAQRARAWAKTQTIEAGVPRWEAAFEDAVRRTRAES
jgi:hypothetical protein